MIVVIENDYDINGIELTRNITTLKIIEMFRNDNVFINYDPAVFGCRKEPFPYGYDIIKNIYATTF